MEIICKLLGPLTFTCYRGSVCPALDKPDWYHNLRIYDKTYIRVKVTVNTVLYVIMCVIT